MRVIEYRLEGAAVKAAEAEPIYRPISNLLDPEAAPAAELAALYQERWEIESALDELKWRSSKKRTPWNGDMKLKSNLISFLNRKRMTE